MQRAWMRMEKSWSGVQDVEETRRLDFPERMGDESSEMGRDRA
jgi:hypothetical protein